jgi:hypothetical protein
MKSTTQAIFLIHPDLKKKIKQIAMDADISMNKLVEGVLAQAFNWTPPNIKPKLVLHSVNVEHIVDKIFNADDEDIDFEEIAEAPEVEAEPRPIDENHIEQMPEYREKGLSWATLEQSMIVNWGYTKKEWENMKEEAIRRWPFIETDELLTQYQAEQKLEKEAKEQVS